MVQTAFCGDDYLYHFNHYSNLPNPERIWLQSTFHMVTYDNYRLLKQVIKDDLLLLGSQTMDIPGAQGVQAETFLRGYLGVKDITDVDINGKAGFKVDLSQPNTEIFEDTFTTIADFGTLEHISDTYNALRNVFEWLKVGGVAIHVNPSQNYICEHHKGCPRFTTEFWEAYAKLTKMKVVLLDEKPAYAESEAIETRVILEKEKGSKAPTKARVEALIKKHLK